MRKVEEDEGTQRVSMGPEELQCVVVVKVERHFFRDDDDASAFFHVE